MAEKRLGAKELRGVPQEDLRAQLAKLQQEFWQQRVKTREGSLQQTHQLRFMRRQMARIQTILVEQGTKHS